MIQRSGSCGHSWTCWVHCLSGAHSATSRRWSSGTGQNRKSQQDGYVAGVGYGGVANVIVRFSKHSVFMEPLAPQVDGDLPMWYVDAVNAPADWSLPPTSLAALSDRAASCRRNNSIQTQHSRRLRQHRQQHRSCQGAQCHRWQQWQPRCPAVQFGWHCGRHCTQ